MTTNNVNPVSSDNPSSNNPVPTNNSVDPSNVATPNLGVASQQETVTAPAMNENPSAATEQQPAEQDILAGYNIDSPSQPESPATQVEVLPNTDAEKNTLEKIVEEKRELRADLPKLPDDKSDVIANTPQPTMPAMEVAAMPSTSADTLSAMPDALTTTPSNMTENSTVAAPATGTDTFTHLPNYNPQPTTKEQPAVDPGPVLNTGQAPATTEPTMPLDNIAPEAKLAGGSDVSPSMEAVNPLAEAVLPTQAIASEMAPIHADVAPATGESMPAAAPATIAPEAPAAIENLVPLSSTPTDSLMNDLVPPPPADMKKMDNSLPPLAQQLDQKKTESTGRGRFGTMMLIIIFVVVGSILLLLGLYLSPNTNLSIPFLDSIFSSLR